jgi:hypothetical protein
VSTIAEALDLLGQLEQVLVEERRRWSELAVAGRTFGYLWEPTRTIGLRQTLLEQQLLVGERPDVFEVQFTAGGFGWVVVHLDLVGRDELAELVFEAWRLTAPEELVVARGERLPE